VLQNLSLDVVQGQGGLSARELIEMTGIPRATLFHILNWLKEKKLVEQKGLHKDSYYLITDAGRSALTAVEKRVAESLQSKRGMVQSDNVIWELVQPKNPIIIPLLVSKSNESNSVQFNQQSNQNPFVVQESNKTGTSNRSPVIGLDNDLAQIIESDIVIDQVERSIHDTMGVGSNPTFEQMDQTKTHDLNWDIQGLPNLSAISGKSNTDQVGLGIADTWTAEPMDNIAIEHYAAQLDIMFSDEIDGESLAEMWALMPDKDRVSFEQRLAQSGGLLDRLSESLSTRACSTVLV
jgi:DNA-binding MarR family transcriptional regulator